MSHRYLRPGQAMAVDASALQRDADGFFLMLGPTTKPNERVGDVAVVYVHGPMDHHGGDGGESYDAIIERVRCAFAGEDEEGVPSAVCIRIDSPGGAVSGLNEMVATLQRMKRAAGIPLVVYVDEMAASAAYALACAGDAIYSPLSGISGSVGVISTMVSQARADDAMGLDFVLLTSGDRKADGHVHALISEDAMVVEQRRVDRLAKQFYRLVGAARPGLPAAKVAGYEAAIFLGTEAMAAGLVDVVAGWDEVLSMISVDAPRQTATSSTMTQGVTPGAGAKPMNAATWAALIKKTEAAIKAEKVAAKKLPLVSALAAYKQAEAAFKKTITHKETHEGDADKDGPDDAPEDDKGDEEEDEEEAKMAEEEEAKGNETDRKEMGDGEEEDDEEEEEEEEEEESEEAAKAVAAAAKKAAASSKSPAEKKAAAAAILAMVSQVTGKSGPSAYGALAAMVTKAKAHDTLQSRVAQIENERRQERKTKLIDKARDGSVMRTNGMRGPVITGKTAKWLRTQKLATVQSFLENTTHALVSTEAITPQDGSGPAATNLRPGEIQLHEGPTTSATSSVSGIPSEALAMMRDAASASEGSVTLDQLIAGYRAQNSATNGMRY